MQTHQLEDLTLLLIRDAAEPEMWLDRWAVSYPMVRVAEAARTQHIEQWQAALQQRPGRASTADAGGGGTRRGRVGLARVALSGDVDTQRRIQT